MQFQLKYKNYKDKKEEICQENNLFNKNQAINLNSNADIY